MTKADLSSGNQSLSNAISPHATHVVEGIHNEESFQYRHAFTAESPRSRFGLDVNNFDQLSGANIHRTRRGDDVPPCSDVLSKASSEMGIEAMLKWPVFERRLSELGIPTAETLVELLGQVSTVEFSSGGSLSKGRETDAVNLDSEKVRHLIENFLVNNNLKNPILDPALLRKYGQEVVDYGLQWDGKTCLLVRENL